MPLISSLGVMNAINFGLASSPSPKKGYIGVVYSTAPGIAIYPWSNGFGSKVSDPSVALSNGGSIDFNSTYSQIGYTDGGTSPYIAVYPWSNGFGSKYSNPSVNPDFAISMKFSNNGNSLIVGRADTPYVYGYRWSASGFGTAYSAPVSAPTTTVNDIAFNYNQTLISLCDSNGFYIWNWSNGFSSKYSQTQSIPSIGRGVCFNNTGGVLAVAHYSSPYISAFVVANPISTKYANPSTLPTGNGNKVNFSNSGAVLAVAHVTAPCVSVYAWSGGFGTKYADPTTAVTGNGTDVVFNSTDSTISVTHGNSPYISVYSWNSGFGSKYSDPSILPGGFAYSSIFF